MTHKPETALEALLTAAQAVIDRWDTPEWKAAEPTAAGINRLRDAIKIAPQKQEWQDISTAPRDGTYIWAYWHNENEVFQGCVSWDNDTDMQDWVDSYNTPFTLSTLTHWMPLPAPPNSGKPITCANVGHLMHPDDTDQICGRCGYQAPDRSGEVVIYGGEL